jgi:hypothetical protein
MRWTGTKTVVLVVITDVILTTLVAKGCSFGALTGMLVFALDTGFSSVLFSFFILVRIFK